MMRTFGLVALYSLLALALVFAGYYFRGQTLPCALAVETIPWSPVPAAGIRL